MMEYNASTVAEMVKRVLAELEKSPAATLATAAPAPAATEGDIPVGISNRHIHLSKEDVETLFGAGYELTPLKDLSQPGQYACKETLTLLGPSMRAIENVRVLGPVRSASQVEISRTDSFTLKVKPPVRESGSIAGSAPVIIVGPKGVVSLKEGCIIANRHIHMHTDDAAKFGVKDGEYIDVDVCGGERRTRWFDVQVRVSSKFALEMHVDTDDANAVGIGNGARVSVVKK
ncbi:MAG: phosphate propanoyltransferase [Clostridia bacterium]|nr:phosphate propanoyltransferase [Clostridia bacterium]